MDIKVIDLKKSKVRKVSNYSNEEKDKYLFDFLNIGLGLKIIKKDLLLTKDIKDNIDFLCVDEAYRLVIVEKRYGKFSRTIKSGLMYIDYIRENLSQIKMLISDSLGVEISKEICYDPRLVILTESFNSYDYSAIKCMPYDIEAINYSFLDSNLVFIKEYQNNNKNYSLYNGNINNDLYCELEDYLLSLGEEVNIFGYRNVISVRKIKAFAYIIIDEVITVYLNKKQYIIKDEKDLEKIKSKLEKEYDEH